jgi:hypothetical protein
LEHELEAAALELEGGTSAEGMDALGQIRDAWRSLPPDVKQDIQQRAKLIWELRGAYFARFVAAVNALFLSDPAIRRTLVVNRDAAVGQIAVRAGQMAQLPPRAPVARPGFSDTQVRQYRRRQYARGRIPGRDPRMGRYRELEHELEMAAEALSAEAEFSQDYPR